MAAAAAASAATGASTATAGNRRYGSRFITGAAGKTGQSPGGFLFTIGAISRFAAPADRAH